MGSRAGAYGGQPISSMSPAENQGTGSRLLL